MDTAGFKHITVTPAEEEDEVIRAGLPETPEDAPETEAQVEPEDALLEPEAQVEPADAPEEEGAPAIEEPAVKPQPERVRARAKKADDYHETTLEDLESGPMPMAQKIVIIAAVICIIGALAYYFAFMR